MSGGGYSPRTAPSASNSATRTSGSGGGYGRVRDHAQHRPKGRRSGQSRTSARRNATTPTGPGWPLAKSLCGIPTLYAWTLAYGHNLLDPDDRIEPWRIRNLIVWHRPNPPVGALGDKVRPSTTYITVACVSDKRWFDLDAERTTRERTAAVRRTHTRATPNHARRTGHSGRMVRSGRPRIKASNPAGAPPLDCWIDGDVWTIPTAPYKGAHYATYPIALPRRLINLMCPRQVCVVCGEPRRRITRRDGVRRQRRGRPAAMDMNRPTGASANEPDSSPRQGTTHRRTN